MSSLRLLIVVFFFLFVAINEANAQADTTRKQKQISAVDVNRNKNQITITYADGSSEKMTEQEANKKGLINNSGYGNQQTVNSAGKPVELRVNKPGAAKPVFVLDGREITEEEMKAINPSGIESINVLKAKTATDKYGVKGKNGVVEINLKSKNSNQTDTIETVDVPKTNVVEKDNRIFTKAQYPPSVDKEEWLYFLETNLFTITKGLESNRAPQGNYTVKVQFIVEKDGSLSNTRVTQHPGYNLDKEILEMMKKSPRWKPAIQNGKAVRAIHTQPINISFSEN